MDSEKVMKALMLLGLRGLKQGEQVSILASAGFPPKDIGQILGTSANAVSVSLSAQKRKKGKK